MPTDDIDRAALLAEAFRLLHGLPIRRLPEAVRALRRLLAPDVAGGAGLRLVREEHEEGVERREGGRVEAG